LKLYVIQLLSFFCQMKVILPEVFDYVRYVYFLKILYSKFMVLKFSFLDYRLDERLELENICRARLYLIGYELL